MSIYKWIYNLEVSYSDYGIRITGNMPSSNSNKKNLLSLRLLYLLISIAIGLIVNLFELNRIVFDIYFLFLFTPENVNFIKNITMKFQVNRETIRNTIDGSYILRFTSLWNFLKNSKKKSREILDLRIFEFPILFILFIITLLLLILIIRASVILFIYLNNSRSHSILEEDSPIISVWFNGNGLLAGATRAVIPGHWCHWPTAIFQRATVNDFLGRVARGRETSRSFMRSFVVGSVDRKLYDPGRLLHDGLAARGYEHREASEACIRS